MIIWISGNSNSGKTTLAKALIGDQKNIVHLDGDVVRKKNNNYDFTREGRWNHCLNVAEEAKKISSSGKCVIVSAIAPYKELRKEIKQHCNCTFLYLPAGVETDDDHPYEWPHIPVPALRVYLQG